ncbi:MAG: TonB-dependent receptor [Bacteroidales bacterium]|nr:TonB-dependent receptor [Bacteroidales bacterium]
MKKRHLTVLWAVCTLWNAYPQKDSLNVYDLNLSQLSQLKITSASKITQNINEIPSSVLVITGQQIRENGYLTIEDALSDLPGFQFRNIQGMNSYVFQRGIPNQNNLSLILVDGVQINELNSGGFYAGGQYNLSNVERIEVIYGPSSVAYGTNAVSGIINIITKNPLENKTELNASAGSFNTAKGDFSFSRANEKKQFGILLSGMYKQSDKANLKGRAGDNNWTDQMDNFEKDYSFDLKVLIKDFVIGTNYINKQSSTATFFKTVDSNYRDYGTLWNILFVNNYVKYNKKISEKVSFSSTIYNRNATVLSNSVYSIVDTAQIGYYRPNNLTGMEHILNYEINKKMSVTGGLTFEYEWLSIKNTNSYSPSSDQKPPKPEKPQMVENHLTSLFIEPRFTLAKNIFLSGGVRFDQSSIYDQILTPRAGLVYHSAKHLLRLFYAEAFRAPKPWDYTDGLGNPGLLPEEMTSLEAAYVLSCSDHLKINLTGYTNHLDNAFRKAFTGDEYRWVNSGGIKVNGLEVFIRYASKKVSSSASYTFNQSQDGFGQSVPEISKHTGNASVTWSFNEHLKLNLRTNYVGKRENTKLIASTNSLFVDPFLILNGAFTYANFKGFDIQLLARNMLNKEYYHTSNRDPDRYRQPQRVVLLSVGYTFKKN